MSTWRQRARTTIEKAMREYDGPIRPGDPDGNIRKHLRQYNSEIRRGFPYKVWLEEVRRAVGLPVHYPKRDNNQTTFYAALSDLQPGTEFHLDGVGKLTINRLGRGRVYVTTSLIKKPFPITHTTLAKTTFKVTP